MINGETNLCGFYPPAVAERAVHLPPRAWWGQVILVHYAGILFHGAICRK